MSANPQALSAAAASAAASLCTPSASTPCVPADVVAHGTGGGGECTSSGSHCIEDLGLCFFCGKRLNDDQYCSCLDAMGGAE